MIRYIIVDDEPLAHRLIEKHAQLLPHLSLQKNCYNALEAMQFLHQHTIDLMFLDITMPKLSGFEFLKTLTNPPKVIVTTAYQEFALEGFELGVLDYLLKPFSFERFVKAINRYTIASEEPSSTNLVHDDGQNTSFFIKGDKKHHYINPSKLLFVEAFGNYVKLYLEDEVIISHEKISALEAILPQNFIRIHKSFIIALDKIKAIEGNQILLENHTLPIGQTYRSHIQKLLK